MRNANFELSPAIKILRGDGKKMGYKIDATTLGVVVVDMQHRFTKRLNKNQENNLVSNHSSLIKECRKKDIPLAILEYEGDGQTHIGLIRSLSPHQRYKFLSKDSPSGFRGTLGKKPSLKEILDEWGVNTLCITGMEASYCVGDTTKEACKQFKVIWVGDLIEDSSGVESKQREINWFKGWGTYFETYQRLLYAIS